MTYLEKQIAFLKKRQERFWHLWEAQMPTQLLAEEGSLIIESLIAIVGPEVLACYARTSLKHAKELDGLCPWEHADDPSLHPIVDYGMCAECIATMRADQ